MQEGTGEERAREVHADTETVLLDNQEQRDRPLLAVEAPEEAPPEDPPDGPAGGVFRDLLVAVTDLTGRWKNSSALYGDCTGSLLYTAALHCATTSRNAGLTFRRLRAAAHQAGVPPEIIDREIMDPLHAGLFSVTRQDMAGYCCGYSRQGQRCKNRAVTLHGLTVGSCAVHRGQRPYSYTVSAEPPYRHQNCGVCQVPVSGDDDVFQSPWAGEVFHEGCFGFELRRYGSTDGADCA